MFVFTKDVPSILVILLWVGIFVSLFVANEVTRKFKWVGFGAFVILPIILTILWTTVLKDTAYMDWFHLAKVYSSTAGCIGFWCIRYIKKLQHNKIALCYPPLILAINIMEACMRDFEISKYSTPVMEFLHNQVQYYAGGSWNVMNGIAGLLNIVTITGWFGICIRKKTAHDNSHDMLWPDMLWFWIVAYDLWNFAYTYNCLPTHAWYCGLALLLAPTVCAFTLGKGAWLQHRAHTLALWCMFAQTFPALQDASKFVVKSIASNDICNEAIKQGLVAKDGYTVLTTPGIHEIIGATPNTTYLFWISLIALIANVLVFLYMIYKIVKTKRNPYKEELYTDLKAYNVVKALGE